MLCSEKRLIANRQNALKSTGPRTADGKARSSLNALTHGLTSQSSTLLPHEDQPAYDQLFAAMLQEHNPRCALEFLLVERLALLAWKLRRCSAAEAALFDQVSRQHQQNIQQQNQQAEKQYQDYLKYRHNSKRLDPPPDPIPLTTPSSAQTLCDFFLRNDDRSNAFARLQRYESNLERSFFKTLQHLHSLQSQPLDPPDQIEPIHAADPPSIQDQPTDPPAPTTNHKPQTTHAPQIEATDPPALATNQKAQTTNARQIEPIFPTPISAAPCPHEAAPS